MQTAFKLVAVSSIALALAACGSAKDANKSNFSKAIQAYLDTQNGICANLPARELPFRLENQDMLGQGRKARADALADAGLLSKHDTELKALFGGTVPGTEYEVTELGRRYLGERHKFAFCTGSYTVVDVDNFTEPSDMMGMKVSQVNFHYKAKDTADWIKNDKVQAAYTNVAEEAKSDIRGHAGLVLTNDGWLHERLFKR